ncbi:MAG: serine hydrolase [Dehalococcoidia bacterium]
MTAMNAQAYTAGTMEPPRHHLLLLAALLLTALTACGTPRSAVRIESATRTAMPAAAAKPTDPPSPRPSAPPGTTKPVPPSPAPTPSTPTVPPPPAASPTTSDDPALLAAIWEALDGDLEHTSVVVRRLHDGRGVSVNAEREYYAASLFKLALLYEAERQRSLGLLDFEDLVQVQDEDIAEDLGTAGLLAIDENGMIPVHTAVQAMVTRSDNTSAVLMLRRLGPATVDQTLAALGLRHTSVNTRELPTTAADMALLMEAIVRGQGVSTAQRAQMRDLLLRQETRWGIPQPLPAGVATGNKTGTWPNATHDVAFVDAPGGLYVIAILSDRGWDWDPIARVSRAVYNVLAG